MKKLLPILLFLCACEAMPWESQTGPPNVIIILTDDQGYGDMSCHGNPYLTTPNIDSLFSQSARFTDFHAGNTCSPTRASLLSGRHNNAVGVWHTIMGRYFLSEGTPTLPEVMQKAGYNTGIFGKWHLGDNYPFRPQDRGFQEVLIHKGGGVGQSPDFWDNDYFDDTYFRNGEPQTFTGYCTDVWFQEALKFIESNKNQPFFCYISTNAPHDPYHVPENYAAPYLNNPEIANPWFYGMIANLDENIGRLREKLQQLGLAENTILVFSTDNGSSGGAQLDENGFVAKGFNAGMRGKKVSVYDGGHRVPLFIHWPSGGLAEGKDIGQLTSVMDLMPTIADLCGLADSLAQPLDGLSLRPLLLGDTTAWPERTLVVDTQREEQLRKWKDAAVLTREWRLVQGNELYQIANDPGQKNDVAAEFPEVVEALRMEYEAWWEYITKDLRDFERIAVGHPKENPVMLSAMDWHSQQQPPWHQKQIRQGIVVNGFWALQVTKTGKYTIKLHRWPPEAAMANHQSLPKGGEIPGGEPYPAGESLDIVEARIWIGGQDAFMEVNEGSPIAFEVQLEEGPIQLQTWLSTSDGTDRGAYFVEILFQPPANEPQS